MNKFFKFLAPVLVFGILLTGCGEEATSELGEEDLVRLVMESFEQEGAEAPQEVKCPDPLPKIEGKIVKCSLILASGKDDTISVAAQVVEGNDIWVSVGDTAEDIEAEGGSTEG